jgi:aldose 1-epimerase
VAGTPFEFDGTQTIGSRISNKNQQLTIGLGYDHNYVLKRKTEDELELAATVIAQSTGIKMELLTKEPGVQFYTGNFLDGTITGRNGITYNKNFALCLETQTFPDSPNKAQFPSPLLLPGEEYNSQTIYRFSIQE